MKTIPDLATASGVRVIHDIDRWPSMERDEFAASLQSLTNMLFDECKPCMQNNLRLALAQSLGHSLKRLLERGIKPKADALYCGESVTIVRLCLPEPDRYQRWLAEVNFADDSGNRIVNAEQLSLTGAKPKSPLDVECPACHAKPGKHCYRPSGHRIFGGGQHASRIRAARKATR